ncbi:hypothetical protein JDN40_05440 [Rhodomicrobium vannielii ATCC 17100]|uniref:hypothetical protein n=1 Tax=Rhodomicrobium vannielii TaxID=1069 RepID=UPI001919C318|nr:hypothetical protein [Rhodomicrobium vannielii]MBJ7533547.1 hypothetical protein [Rhodomicrobium vannielii ATCC 17100]
MQTELNPDQLSQKDIDDLKSGNPLRQQTAVARIFTGQIGNFPAATAGKALAMAFGFSGASGGRSFEAYRSLLEPGMVITSRDDFGYTPKFNVAGAKVGAGPLVQAGIAVAHQIKTEIQTVTQNATAQQRDALDTMAAGYENMLDRNGNDLSHWSDKDLADVREALTQARAKAEKLGGPDRNRD